MTGSQAWGEENRSLILCNLSHQKNNLQVGVPKNEREDPKGEWQIMVFPLFVFKHTQETALKKKKVTKHKTPSNTEIPVQENITVLQKYYSLFL